MRTSEQPACRFLVGRAFFATRYSRNELRKHLEDASMYRTLDGMPDFIVFLNRAGNEKFIREAKLARYCLSPCM